MSDPIVRRSNFDEAIASQALDLETLREITSKIREHYELSGSWPSATQLRALLLRPGL